MSSARDIALVFLCLQAMALAIVPLALISALAYGIYRLHKAAKRYLRLAQIYVQQAHDGVERVSRKVTDPFIQVHVQAKKIDTIATHLATRRQL